MLKPCSGSPVGQEYVVLGGDYRGLHGGDGGKVTGEPGSRVSDQESVSQSSQKNGEAGKKDQDSPGKI